MYRQSDYYSFDEYGTGDIPEYREPCGAFYGLPFSGEDDGDMPIYVKEQMRDYMPDANLLAGEMRRKRPDEDEQEAERRARERVAAHDLKPETNDRAQRLIETFRMYCSPTLTWDIQAHFIAIVRKYVDDGEGYRLNEICDMLKQYCGIEPSAL